MTDAPDYTYLNGNSVSGGGSAAFGIGIGSEFMTFKDSETQEIYHGISRSIGYGAGAELHDTVSVTYTLGVINYFTQIDDLLSEYIQESILAEERGMQ